MAKKKPKVAGTCSSCRWYKLCRKMKKRACTNSTQKAVVGSVFYPGPDYGCAQWRKKGSR